MLIIGVHGIVAVGELLIDYLIMDNVALHINHLTVGQSSVAGPHIIREAINLGRELDSVSLSVFIGRVNIAVVIKLPAVGIVKEMGI